MKKLLSDPRRRRWVCVALFVISVSAAVANAWTHHASGLAGAVVGVLASSMALRDNGVSCYIAGLRETHPILREPR